MKRIILTAILALAALTASAQTLVVYYSKPGETYTQDGVINLIKGNTQEVAERIQKFAKADIFRVETVKNYPDEYLKLIDVAKEELNSKARPAIKGDIDISKYDTIYIGWPCWWGTLPMCMFTFIEKHDWSGKTVIPFTTHEGSGFGSGLRDLRAAVKGATVAKGLSLRGTAARSSDAQIEKFVTGD
ncbi:MAG: flavodoxin [Bacteroidales bacterium]|nr:flavodoxin [Bacteroidales bacterium]